jgi:hypothetical protein
MNMSQNILIANKIFGDFIDPYIPIFDLISESTESIQYKFISDTDFAAILERDKSEGMYIYWQEIIFRAHLAGLTSILRHKHWMNAMIQSVSYENYFAFAASTRGLIEAAADTFDALRLVPSTLADQYLHIRSSLDRSQSEFYVSKELEDNLIHYSHARTSKNNIKLSYPHKAKNAKEYLDILSGADEKQIYECYSFLCDITHPSYASVLFFLDINEDGSLILYQKNPDSVNILNFISKYKNMMQNLFHMSLNPAILTLRLINKLSIKNLFISTLENINLDSIPLWGKMKMKMGI